MIGGVEQPLALKQESLRLATKYLPRSVPLVLVATVSLAGLCWKTGNHGWACTVAALGSVAAVWRLLLARHLARDGGWSDTELRRVVRGIEANALVTGLAWVIGTLAIYPDLHEQDRANYAAGLFAYLGIAACFTPLIGPFVGRSFTVLALALMAPLVGLSLADGSSHSLFMAALAAGGGLLMHVGASKFARALLAAQERSFELHGALQAEAEASRAKGVFVDNMSHEIRTPLMAVIGFAEELLDGDQTPEQHRQAARTVHRAGKHLLNVVGSILDLSKADARKIDVEIGAVELLPLLGEVVEFARLQAAAKGLELFVKPSFPLPRVIDTDALRLRQILLNLVANAIKFTDRGSVSLGASYDADDKQLILSVVDTGIGISEVQLARLFQPFVQADPSIDRRYGGSGLGLAISKRLAELLGGRLEVSSMPGAGSCFLMVLPLPAVDSWVYDAPTARPSARVMVPAELAPLDGRVLLAEDNVDNQNLIRRKLGRFGVTLEVVGNGELAVSAAMMMAPDLVLMDLQMPVMDGLCATRNLRACGYVGAIVALTANASAGTRLACEEAGCNEYLTKPLSQQELEAVLRRYLKSTTAQAVAPRGPLAHPCLRSTLLSEGPEMADLVGYILPRLPDYAARMHSAVVAMDFERIGKVAHDLKSVGGGYGFPVLHDLALEAEAAAEVRDLGSIRSLDQRLTQCVDQILASSVEASDGVSAQAPQPPDQATALEVSTA